MASTTRSAALIFWAIILSAQTLPATSCCKPQGYNRRLKPDEISYEYYELPSDIRLTQTELAAMKSLLAKAVFKYNYRIPARYREMRIGLENYGVQYKAKLDEKGDKIVEINAFAKEKREQNTYKNLTTELVVVFDGGSSFFNTIINLKRKKAAPVFIHGLA